MCGICGVAYAEPGRPVDVEMLRAMATVLQHRGPDGEGYHLAPGVGLGFRRLSIIDLQTGDQPISSEDGAVTVVCNGEIYNYVELREQLLAAGHRFRSRSDVEVIVHLYEDLGPACLDRLRGMFGFALWDARRQSLMLARDRMGIKPLHYALTPEGLCFGSELKAILAGGVDGQRVDLRALRDLFVFGFVLGPGTLLEGIRSVLPGHYLLYRQGVLTDHQYWDLRFPSRGDEGPRRSADEWTAALRDKLTETMRVHLRSDVPVGAWLSGGIDSSLIASLAGGLSGEPVETFSLGFQDPACDELRGWRILTEFAGYEQPNQRALCRDDDLALFRRALWHCEVPSASGIEIPRLILSEATAQRVRVALTGEGADEVFGGYGWYQVDRLLRPLAWLPRGLRRLMLLGPLIPSRWPGASKIHLAPRRMDLARYRHMVGLYHPETLPELFSADVRAALAQLPAEDARLTEPEGFDNWHPFNQLQYCEAKTRLPDHINHVLDRASMACSLETRLPFLDHELVELCSGIPPQLMMRGLQEKYILRRAAQGALPEEIVWRRKRGLRAPFVGWMRADLPDAVADRLSARCLREKGYFDPAFVAWMLAEHRAGRRNYGRQLMAVLAVQLWDDLFMHGSWRGMRAGE